MQRGRDPLICTNQGDYAERAERVGWMWEGHYSAHRVAIWLGEGTREVARRSSRMCLTSEIVDKGFSNPALGGRLPTRLKRKVGPLIRQC
jgi:hypothetical protein